MIKVKNLKKTYRVHKKNPGLKGSIRSLFNRKWTDKNALKGVSLRVEEGEILGLVGANGAGKTTLVKILAGIIHPTSGDVDVLGYNPFRRQTEFQKQIALIMGQKAQLWWDLPASDSFLLLREIYRVPVAVFKERLDFLVETLSVRDQMNIQIRRLSLGERMKMELIAALLHAPRVMFLDEPTIGLDLMAQKAIRDFILDYRKKHNPAMIITSHYMEDIERLCERIVIISEGEIIYDGSLKKIVMEYAVNKVITARLDKNGPAMKHDFPSDLGEVLAMDDDFIRVQVSREKVPESASLILSRYPVIDLSIEEEDIGTVIESILRKGIS